MAQKDLLSVIKELMEAEVNQPLDNATAKPTGGKQSATAEPNKGPKKTEGLKDEGGKKGTGGGSESADTQGVLGKKSGAALDAGGDKDVGSIDGKKAKPSGASATAEPNKGPHSQAGEGLKETKMKEGNAVAAKAAAAKAAGKDEFELDGKKMPVTMSDKTAKKINETEQEPSNKKNLVDKQEKMKTAATVEADKEVNAEPIKDTGGKKPVEEGTVELSIEVDADELAAIAQSGQDQVNLGDIETDGEEDPMAQDGEVPGDATDLPPDAAGPEAPGAEQPGMEPQGGDEEEPPIDGEPEMGQEPQDGEEKPPMGGDEEEPEMGGDDEQQPPIDGGEEEPGDDEGGFPPKDGEEGDDEEDPEQEEEGATDPAQKIAELEAELDALKKQLGQSEEEGAGLEEDFKQKATIIFETAVNQKVSTIKGQLEEQYSTKLEKEVEVINTKINEFVDYAVQEWIKENQLEIKYSLRTEIAENFIRGLKGLLEENYIEIPDEEVSVVDELTEAVESYKEQLEEQTIALEEAQAELLNIKRSEVFEEVAGGLTETQKIRLEKLSESVEATDIDEFRFKVEQLRESFFDGNSESPLLSSLSEEVFGTDQSQRVDEDSTVSQYASFLSRTVLK